MVLSPLVLLALYFSLLEIFHTNFSPKNQVLPSPIQFCSIPRPMEETNDSNKYDNTHEIALLQIYKSISYTTPILRPNTPLSWCAPKCYNYLGYEWSGSGVCNKRTYRKDKTCLIGLPHILWQFPCSYTSWKGCCSHVVHLTMAVPQMTGSSIRNGQVPVRKHLWKTSSLICFLQRRTGEITGTFKWTVERCWWACFIVRVWE